MRMPPRLVRAVARAKPAVPDRLWPLVASLRSVVGDGPLVAPPDFARALVLAAHPDDESLGCAGTLALLADGGATVTVVFATDGEATRGSSAAPGDTARLRRGEGQGACRILGVDRVRHLGLSDGGLTADVGSLAGALSEVVAECNPEVLLLPWFLDGHPDHQALSTALARARAPAHLEVWGYETWTPVPANRLVDITAVVERKRRALAAHTTAQLAIDLEAGLGLSRWRSLHGLMGRGYAEAFLAAPVGRYLQLADQAWAGTRAMAPAGAPAGGEAGAASTARASDGSGASDRTEP